MEAILMKIYEYYTGEERNMLLHAYDYAPTRSAPRASPISSTPVPWRRS